MNWSYITGFFDGEGSAMMSTKNYQVSISFYNTHLATLQSIQEFIGCGRIGWIDRKTKQHGIKRQYILRISDHLDVLKLAKSLIGESIIKTEVLKKLIDHIESKKWNGAKLSWSQVLELRAFAAKGEDSKSLATKFRITQGYVNQITRGSRRVKEAHGVRYIPYQSHGLTVP